MMIVCTHCLHHNPSHLTGCEICHTPLPSQGSCPNCGSAIQSTSRFCGQCGFNLQLVSARQINAKSTDSESFVAHSLLPEPAPPMPILNMGQTARGFQKADQNGAKARESAASQSLHTLENEPDHEPDDFNFADDAADIPNTEIQIRQYSPALLHQQSQTLTKLSKQKKIIHIGKPNDRVPPDVNVSFFANAEVVSRVHADLHIEGESFFIEDTGSANGTYLNSVPLKPNVRHPLRVGDQISLGKGEVMTFIFQMA